MTNIRPGVQLQNMQEPYRRVVEDIVNLSMKVEEDMTDYELMPMGEYISEIVRSKDAELATLRAENERLRILVKDSVNLLDFLFEPGSYVPAVRLFCEKVKEELK